MIRFFFFILICLMLAGCVVVEKKATVWLTYEEAVKECPSCLAGMEDVKK